MSRLRTRDVERTVQATPAPDTADSGEARQDLSGPGEVGGEDDVQELLPCAEPHVVPEAANGLVADLDRSC